MKDILQKKYGLKNPEIKPLLGYDIVNYKINDDRSQYILKVYPDKKREIDFAQAENEILLHLQQKNGNCFPKPIFNTDKHLLTPFIEKGSKKTARLLTFLEGHFLGEAPHTKTRFSSLGRCLPKMDIQSIYIQHY